MQFSYWAKSCTGNDIYGRVDAADIAAAAAQIRAMGHTPLDVVEIAALGSLRRPVFPRRITQKDKIVFFRQLATMVSAGVSLAESLSVLAAQTENGRFRSVIAAIAAQVRQGRPLSQAFAAQRGVFPEILSALLKTGEESGRIDEILQQLADALERKNELRQKIATALVYPAAVVLVAFAVLVVLVAVIIPQFETVFANLGAEMPKMTAWAFALGRFVRGGAYEMLLLLGLLFSFACLCTRNARGRAALDALCLRLPVFGEIFRNAAYARAFRSMHLLLSSGVAVAEALELSGRVAANEVVREHFISVRRGVVMGTAMHKTMTEDGSFCPVVRHMVAVGEETGRTDRMFEKLGLWYSAELSEKVRRLTMLLEPFIVVLVGLVVAFMAFSIFLPVISSIQHLI